MTGGGSVGSCKTLGHPKRDRQILRHGVTRGVQAPLSRSAVGLGRVYCNRNAVRAVGVRRAAHRTLGLWLMAGSGRGCMRQPLFTMFRGTGKVLAVSLDEIAGIHTYHWLDALYNFFDSSWRVSYTLMRRWQCLLCYYDIKPPSSRDTQFPSLVGKVP